jgi:hypothetical protein
MKKGNIYYLIFYCLCITAISCSKNKSESLKESNNDLLTDQVEKIETFLAKGAAKPPLITDPSIPKVETSASPALRAKLDAQWQKEIEASYKKSRVMGVMGAATNPYAFAVFKGSSCGGYPELEIKMDCENRRSTTSASGWTGGSGVDDYKDVYLHFCVIDADYNSYMSPSTIPYGFLFLGESWYIPTDPNTFPYPRGMSKYFWPLQSFVRVFDNEDDGNDNTVWLDGVQQPLIYWLGPSGHSQAAYVNENTRLHFIVAPGNSSGGSPRLFIPGLSDYGLLGTFGSFQGSFSIDDEDTNNRNVAEVGGYYAYTEDATGNRITNPFPYASTIEPSQNTIMHLSRVH